MRICTPTLFLNVEFSIPLFTLLVSETNVASTYKHFILVIFVSGYYASGLLCCKAFDTRSVARGLTSIRFQSREKIFFSF